MKSITQRVFIGSISELSISQILSISIVFLDDEKNVGDVNGSSAQYILQAYKFHQNNTRSYL